MAAGLSTPTAPRAQSFDFSATRISGWKVLSWKFWWSRFFS